MPWGCGSIHNIYTKAACRKAHCQATSLLGWFYRFQIESFNVALAKIIFNTLILTFCAVLYKMS